MDYTLQEVLGKEESGTEKTVAFSKKDNSPVHIKNAVKGDKYFFFNDNEDVLCEIGSQKLGKKAPHFRHLRTGEPSRIHSKFIEAIASMDEFYIPNFIFEKNEWENSKPLSYRSGTKCHQEALGSSEEEREANLSYGRKFSIKNVKPEHTYHKNESNGLSEIRPDISFEIEEDYYKPGIQYALEVTFTNQKSTEDKQKQRKHGLYTLELDISKLYPFSRFEDESKKDYSIAKIVDFLESGEAEEHIRWLTHSVEDGKLSWQENISRNYSNLSFWEKVGHISFFVFVTFLSIVTSIFFSIFWGFLFIFLIIYPALGYVFRQTYYEKLVKKDGFIPKKINNNPINKKYKNSISLLITETWETTKFFAFLIKQKVLSVAHSKN